MKKEEVLEVLKSCEIQYYYVHYNDILAVLCKEITWKELKVLAKDILYITEENGCIRVAVELG